MTETELPLDVARLAEVMRSRGLHVAGDLQLARVGFGQSNLTYRASDDEGKSWIVRRPPLGELLASAHDVEREYAILAALGPTDVPVPVMHCAVDRGVVADVPVIVMEHVDGAVIDGFEGLGELRGDARQAVVPHLSTVLASIHAVDVAQVGLDGLASHQPYAARQLKRWSAQWEKSRTRELPSLDALTQLLRDRAPTRPGYRLLHGDYSPRNLILDPRTGRIRAVLDWELSTLGDPLADVGTTLAYWSIADEVQAAKGATVGAEDERARFVRGYLEASGDDGDDIPYWHALGLWKLAIITEGVIRRALDQPGNAAAMGVPLPEHVEQVIELADAAMGRTVSFEGDSPHHIQTRSVT